MSWNTVYWLCLPTPNAAVAAETAPHSQPIMLQVSAVENTAFCVKIAGLYFFFLKGWVLVMAGFEGPSACHLN